MRVTFNTAFSFATLLIMFLSGCSTPAVPKPTIIQQWGSMKQVLRQGHTEARVRLSEICASDNMVAVGALEGLKGEITVINGEAWIARAPEVDEIVGEHTRTSTASATLMVASDIEAWQEILITEESDDDLDAIVLAHATAVGVDVSRPFPFLIEGEFADVHLHVIRGGCPIANPDGPKPARAEEVLAQGKIVGFYAANSAGNLTHHTSDVHAHVVIDGEKLVSGHMDSVKLKVGNILRLPIR